MQAIKTKGVETKDERVALGTRLLQEYEAAKNHRSALVPRWEKIESLVRNDPQQPSELPWDGAVYRNLPVMRPKALAWQSYICGPPTQALPYFLGTIFGNDAIRANEVEDDFFLFMKKARWERAFRRNVWNTGVYGKGIWRVRVETEGTPNFVFESILPRRFFGYPNGDQGIPGMLLVGHEYEIRYADAVKMQKSGEFYNDIAVKPEITKAEPAVDGKTSQTESNAVQQEDQPIRCAEAFRKLMLGDDTEERWYLVRFCIASANLLSVEPYQYSRPWYFDQFVHEEQDRFWPETSKFNDLQDIQLGTNDIWNDMRWGAQMSAFPTQFAQGWALPQKYARTKPGTVVPILQGGQVTGIRSQYDPSVNPLLLSDLERRADAMTSIGAQQTGSTPTYDKTATGAAIREQAKGARITDDLAYIDICQGEIGEFMQELYRSHYDAFLFTYGDVLQVKDPAILDKEIQWTLYGKNPAVTPQAQTEAAFSIAQMLGQLNPQVMMVLEMAGINSQALIKTIVANSALENRQAILTPNANQIQQPNQQPNQPPAFPGGPGSVPVAPGMAVGPISGGPPQYGPGQWTQRPSNGQPGNY